MGQQSCVSRLPVLLVSSSHPAHSDTDKGLEYFFEQCVQAGQLKCALYERTPKAVAARVQRIFDSLKTHPIPVVIGDGPGDYDVVDYVKVRRTVFDFLYSPFAIGGQALAGILAALEKGDGVPYYAAHIDGRNYLQCQSDESIRQDGAGFTQLASMAIGCSDADQVNDTLPQLQKWFEGNKKQSSFAELLPYRIYCAYVFLHIACQSHPVLHVRTEAGRFDQQRSSKVPLGVPTLASLCSSLATPPTRSLRLFRRRRCQSTSKAPFCSRSIPQG
jgi:hypothetical protein